MSAADLLDFSPEVAEARLAKKPIVALELTIITHGMPYPRNVETALAVEHAARYTGGVPATIAVIGGRFKSLRLHQQEIDQLGELSGGVVKASRRDRRRSPPRVRWARRSQRRCSLPSPGIEIFATGGIVVGGSPEETFHICG